MKSKALVPVILAGGAGTRLWPLSRKSYPKQFTNLFGKLSLFQQAALRVKSDETFKFAPVITVTNEEYRFIAAQQLQELEVSKGSILIEPMAKNTAAAILAAVIHAEGMYDDPTILVVSSDHAIPDTYNFKETVKLGLQLAELEKVVTFGIKPIYPETGYGYLELADKVSNGPSEVKRFIEKPILSAAQKMLQAGNFVWNAGIFMFSVSTIVKNFKLYAPTIYEHVSNSVSGSTLDLDFIRFQKQSWSKLPDISFDYAILEKCNDLVAVPFNGSWSDLGGWDAVFKEMKADQNGVALTDNAHALDCRNSMLRSESSDQEIIGIGLENILAVAMPDAVLVANKENAQDVKKAVSIMAKQGIRQANSSSKDHRPWGWFESLVMQDRFQVKRIMVYPGAALSLQSHHHRSEHWIVVQGTARVTLGEDIKLVTEGQSIYIPLGVIHRMENPGKIPMILIEVQTGTYLQEDDILRYDDVYARK